MTKKILVADDSLTIQKVVSITFKSKPFQLIETRSEKDLLTRVKKDPYDLILLDFNLSDSKSGYQLAKEIKEVAKTTPILAMLGTFDSVNESQLLEAGIDEKIVKPFESEKFIEICESLLSGEVSSESSFVSSDSTKENDELEDDNLGQGWAIDDETNQSEEQEDLESTEMDFANEESPEDEIESFEEDTAEHVNPLVSEVEGWEASVPGKIDTNEKLHAAFPPVIEKSTSSNHIVSEVASIESDEPSTQDEPTANFQMPEELSTASEDTTSESEQDEVILPSDEDLDYPDMGIASESEEAQDKATSKLVPLDELTAEPSEEVAEQTDLTSEEIPKEKIELQKEIEEDVSPEEFWAVDENAESSAQEQTTFSRSEEGGKAQPEEALEQKPSVDVEQQAFAIKEEALNKVMEELKEELPKVLEPLIKESCKEIVERVAWEVIPDLAENLIKSELKNISESLESEVNQ